MMGVREAVEQAIFVAVGAAALTRERAESIVDDLVRRGQLGEDEGRLTVDHLMERARQAGGGSAAGLVGKIEGGMQGLLRDFGIAQRDDLADVDQRISDLEHRIRLLEGSSGSAPAAPGPDAG
jgi:polyhydroxyalkanoate synthesis regulator phasin